MQPDDVPVEAAGEQDEALLARRGEYGAGAVGALLGELEREHRAEPADVGALGRDPLEPRAHGLADLAGPRQEARGAASSVALAAAQAAGLPPKVPPSPPGAGASISSARPVTEASGSPPPSDLPATSRSGSTS